MSQIAPSDANVNTEALFQRDLLNRAEIMLQQAAKLKCRSFVTPQDVVNGVYKLNLAFVANLFNNHPGLEQKNGDIDGMVTIEETREERSKLSFGLYKYVLIAVYTRTHLWEKSHYLTFDRYFLYECFILRRKTLYFLFKKQIFGASENQTILNNIFPILLPLHCKYFYPTIQKISYVSVKS